MCSATILTKEFRSLFVTVLFCFFFPLTRVQFLEEKTMLPAAYFMSKLHQVIFDVTATILNFSLKKEQFRQEEKYEKCN